MSETKRALGGYSLYTVDANSAVAGNIDAWCDFMIVHGNLQVQGNTVSQSNLDVTDNIISVNVGETGNGVTLGTAGLSVDRGNLPNTALLWNEAVTSWTLTNDGNVYSNIMTNVVEDLTPQLGGNLDVNGFEIQSIGTDDIILSVSGSAGNVVVKTNVSRTLSLLHFDGADGSNTFVDEVDGHTFTNQNPNGVLEHDTAQFQFGNASLMMSNAAVLRLDGIDRANVEDWTLEGFVRLEGTLNDSISFQLRDSEGTYPTDTVATIIVNPYYGFPAEVYFNVYAPNGTAIASDTSGNIAAANTWVHLAMVRDKSASTYSFYIAGTRIAEVSTAEDARLADYLYTYTNSTPGNVWFDEIRYTTGAEYSGASFTPPASPFTVETSGYLVLEDYLLLPKQYTDPAVVTDNTFVYHKDVGNGGTGVYSHNSEMEESPDELVSKRKAILYGLIL